MVTYPYLINGLQYYTWLTDSTKKEMTALHLQIESEKF